MEQLPRLLARRETLLPADERPVLAASPDDLDWSAIEAYHAALRKDARRFDGTAVEQVEAVVRYLETSPFLPVASRLVGVGREDLPAYSLRALREAVVNAVAHRDYALAGAQVRVQLYLDRIEVTSPGRLPNSLTPEDLFAGAQPVRRNQVLVGFLSDPATVAKGRAPMEGMGEGFLTIVRESERLEGGRAPEVRQHTDAFTVTIYRAEPSELSEG